MFLKAKKYAAIGMVMAVLLSIVSACTPASVDITPGSTPDTQAMTTPEITAEPTAKPTPKPTMTPAPTPIGEPKRLVYAEGDEMPEYDDSVYDEYDIVTIYYPDGNSREENPRPFGVSMLLPKGWTWRDGIFDGLGYFPSEELAGHCIAEWRCGFHTKSIYNEKGECVATVGYTEWDWSDETLEGFAEALDIELTRETLESWSNQEKASFGLYHTFGWVTLGKTMAALCLGDRYDHDVESGANSKTVVTISTYCDKSSGKTPEERLTMELPVAATFDLTYNVGIFVEFGDGQLTSEQIDFIAESIRFCGLEW